MGRRPIVQGRAVDVTTSRFHPCRADRHQRRHHPRNVQRRSIRRPTYPGPTYPELVFLSVTALKLGSFWQNDTIPVSCCDSANTSPSPYKSLKLSLPVEAFKAYATLVCAWCGSNVRSGRVTPVDATSACFRLNITLPHFSLRIAWILRSSNCTLANSTADAQCSSQAVSLVSARAIAWTFGNLVKTGRQRARQTMSERVAARYHLANSGLRTGAALGIGAVSSESAFR